MLRTTDITEVQFHLQSALRVLHEIALDAPEGSEDQRDCETIAHDIVTIYDNLVVYSLDGEWSS